MAEPLKYLFTNCADDVDPLKIKSSKDSYAVDFPVTKSTSTLKLGPFNGGHFKSSCWFKTMVSINGLVSNFVTHKVELFVIFAESGVYNFNIKLSTTSSGLTNSFPNSSVDFLDNVQSSFSQLEIKN